MIFAVNPHSGAGARGTLIHDCKQAVAAKGFNVIVESSIHAITEQAMEHQQVGQLQAVVSVGGDGTLALWANLLPAEVKLCVLPLGTENIVARYLGYRRTPVELAEVVANGAELCWDVGVANGRSFLAILGAGFDAEVVSRVHATRRGHISYFSYALPILQSIASYPYPEIKITAWQEGGANPVVCGARWAFVANLHRYALNLDICPMAKIDDGLLHGAFFSRSGLFWGLRYLWKIKSGTHLDDPSVTSLSGVRFRLESEKRVPYQLDGDPAGELPVEVSVLPRRLRLLVPSGMKARST